MSPRTAPLDAYGATMTCDCGAKEWQAVIDPPRAVKWECRDCGARYDADGRRIRDAR